MTNHNNDFSRSIRLCFAIAFFSIIVVIRSEAQSIQRQSIGICGSNMVSDGTLIKQTIGQPYATITYYNNGIGFRPGFQQPSGASARTSIIEKQLSQSFLNVKLFPNPTASLATIESQELIANAFLKVMDSNGRLLIKEQVTGMKSHSINCENWPAGLYFISISDEHNTSYSSKLIITK